MTAALQMSNIAPSSSMSYDASVNTHQTARGADNGRTHFNQNAVLGSNRGEIGASTEDQGLTGRIVSRESTTFPQSMVKQDVIAGWYDIREASLPQRPPMSSGTLAGQQEQNRRHTSDVGDTQPQVPSITMGGIDILRQGGSRHQNRDPSNMVTMIGAPANETATVSGENIHRTESVNIPLSSNVSVGQRFATEAQPQTPSDSRTNNAMIAPPQSSAKMRPSRGAFVSPDVGIAVDHSISEHFGPVAPDLPSTQRPREGWMSRVAPSAFVSPGMHRNTEGAGLRVFST